MSRALFLVARDVALAGSQEAPLTKNALGGQLGPYSSPSLVSARRGVTKASPVSCERGEGQRAQHRRRTHMTGARSDEANSAQAGVSCVCKFEMQKKGENQAVAGGIVSRIELMTTIAENSN